MLTTKKLVNKSIMLLFTFLIITNHLKSQINLVPNPSMENIPNCVSWTLIPKAPPCSPWIDMKFNTASYANSCANSINQSLGVPRNDFSLKNYQNAHSGNGYLFFKTLNSSVPNIVKSHRVYQQVQLTNNLISNKKYFCGFYVALADSSKYATNNIAMSITKNMLVQDTSGGKNGNLSVKANIYNYGNLIIKDTQNWVLISGIYTAQGGEQFITIGNFKDNSETEVDSIFNNSNVRLSIYSLDDVFVYELNSNYCLPANAGRDTTIKLGDSVFIGSYTYGIDTIKWYDGNGQVVDTIQPGFWVKPTTAGLYRYIVEQTVNGCLTKDTVYVNVSLLPLTIVNYTLLNVHERQVLNEWTTANEINVSHYNIERSVNAKDFVVVGKLKAHNQQQNNYIFTDELTTNTQHKTMYYRIAGVDNDGRKTYSSTKQITTKPQTLHSVSIYPNPAKDMVFVKSKEPMQEIDVVDYFGRIVLKLMVNGSQSHTLSLQHQLLTTGLYTLKITLTNKMVENKKLIKE